eukprot:2361118-Pleurochrysis_carterae.AAC.1
MKLARRELATSKNQFKRMEVEQRTLVIVKDLFEFTERLMRFTLYAAFLWRCSARSRMKHLYLRNEWRPHHIIMLRVWNRGSHLTSFFPNPLAESVTQNMQEYSARVHQQPTCRTC